MTADELRARQAPLKAKYKDDPATARITLRASGALVPGEPRCQVRTWAGVADAGLHPATGGDGTLACSGDMLLEALAGCAGVTLGAVATALGVPLRGATVEVEGDLDFRGTLGVGREAPVGFTDIRLTFRLDSDAPAAQLDKLVELTERYCVVLRTLTNPPTLRAGRA